MRVGATSAVALRHLARKDASVLGLIGSGNQARTQLQGAIAVMAKLKQINVFSMNFKNRDRFVHEMKGETRAKLIGVDNPEAAVSESDVVICATNSSEPVFDGQWLKKGTTVISIVGGDHTLKRREIDDVVLEKSRAIFVNSKLQIRLDEQATLFDPIKKEVKRENVIFELGDLLRGNVRGRLDDDEIITYHNNCGMGIQFAAVGAVVYQRAMASGIGRPLPAEWFRTSP